MEVGAETRNQGLKCLRRWLDDGGNDGTPRTMVLRRPEQHEELPLDRGLNLVLSNLSTGAY